MMFTQFHYENETCCKQNISLYSREYVRKEPELKGNAD